MAVLLNYMKRLLKKLRSIRQTAFLRYYSFELNNKLFFIEKLF